MHQIDVEQNKISLEDWAVRQAYRRSFEIEEPAGSYEVSLGDWKGTVCEVKVGGSLRNLYGLLSDFSLLSN